MNASWNGRQLWFFAVSGLASASSRLSAVSLSCLGRQGVHPLQVHGLIREPEGGQCCLVRLQHPDPGLDPVGCPPRRSERVGGVLGVTGQVAGRVGTRASCWSIQVR